MTTNDLIPKIHDVYLLDYQQAIAVGFGTLAVIALGCSSQ